jgi:hypothetical protein
MANSSKTGFLGLPEASFTIPFLRVNLQGMAWFQAISGNVSLWTIFGWFFG